MPLLLFKDASSLGTPGQAKNAPRLVPRRHAMQERKTGVLHPGIGPLEEACHSGNDAVKSARAYPPSRRE